MIRAKPGVDPKKRGCLKSGVPERMGGGSRERRWYACGVERCGKASRRGGRLLPSKGGERGEERRMRSATAGKVLLSTCLSRRRLLLSEAVVLLPRVLLQCEREREEEEKKRVEEKKVGERGQCKSK